MSFFTKLFTKSKDTVDLKVKDQLAFLEVDMHNHLLPGIDDGAKSLEDSLVLIKGLNHLGFSKFVCTPHIMAGIHPNNASTIAAAHDVLKAGLRDNHLAIQTSAAAEHMIDEGLVSLMDQHAVCLMPGGYILIEMSYLAESKAIFDVIYNLQLGGYKPILAHPERYNYYHGNTNIYKKIKDTGCLLQLNLLSISRYYGSHVKEAAQSLIQSGMYDFVGTDTHHVRHLAALNEVVSKYSIRNILRNCPIRNAALAEEMKALPGVQ